MYSRQAVIAGVVIARRQDHTLTPMSHRLLMVAVCNRAEALAAHAEAAQRILDANNAGAERGPWELDLHGLHASEAIDALDERLTGASQC